MSKNHDEEALRTVASQQHAAISRRQALALGLGRTAIQTRLGNGSWLPARRGTYVTAGSPHTWEQRVMAAVLSGGADAVASHLTAASLWCLIEEIPTTIDITVRHNRRPATAADRIVHRSRTMPEVRRVSGIPVTSPARTLVDLAGQVDERRLESALDTALKRRLVSVSSVRRYIEMNALGNRRGVALLRRLLTDRIKGVPESELERVFLRVLKQARLREPARQYRIGARRVDVAYVDERIAIELDGFSDHGKKLMFEDDRRRQNALVLEGWVVLRFTWDDVTKRPDAVVATIARALLRS